VGASMDWRGGSCHKNIFFKLSIPFIVTGTNWAILTRPGLFTEIINYNYKNLL